jgi:hypothetical protein
MKQKAMQLRNRIPLLQERISLLETFLSLGLRKVDVSNRSGLSLPNISAFFSGMNDSQVIEHEIRQMISEVQHESDQVSA